MLSSVYILLANARRRSARQSTAKNNGIAKRRLNDAATVIDLRVIEQLVYAERFLTDDFMAGDQFSMADISAFTIAASFRDRLDWAVLSRLSRWFDAIEARPAVQRGLKAF